MKLRHVDGFAVLVVVFLFVASMFSHAQVAGSYVQPLTQPSYSVPDHPMHASQGDLRPEVSLLGNGSGVTTAHGDRPLSDFPTYTYVKPLGDVAREYREEKFATRGHSGSGRSPQYSHIYWEQQGNSK
jgi:hypothetical protein